jgi:Na+-transporting NADH:ubiquinone oxidoreductase subunit E
MSPLTLFFQSAFIENLALSYFLGMCTFLAVSRRVETAFGLGVAMFAVMTLTVPVSHLMHEFLLRPGAWAWIGAPDLDLGHLALICYIGVIAAMIQILEMVLDRHFPRLFRALGIFLPLLTVNCAILGASLFTVERNQSFLESVVYGAGSGLGWLLAVVVLASIRERLRYADPPKGLEGLGLTFIVTGLMSLAYMSFAGIVLN